MPVSQKIAFISSTPSKLSVFAQIAICAFRYFLAILFETIAYNHGAAANVVVVLMASAAISALFLGGLF